MKNAVELRVGIFVFISLLIFMAVVFLIGEERKFFTERYLLVAEFSDVQGLLEGAPVRVSGVDVGIVKKVSFSGIAKEKKIKVELLLDKRVQNRIREDSYAMIQTMGLLGDKYVEISQGNPEKKVIPSGGIVQSIAPPDLYQVLQKGNIIIDNTIKITDSLHKILGSFGTKESTQDLAATIKSLRNLVSEVEKNKKAFGHLYQASLSLKKILDEIEKGKGSLHSLIYDKKGLPLDHISATIKSLNEILEEIKEGESLLSFLILDKKGKELAKNLSNSSEALEEIITKVKKGDGLLKKLIYDQEGGQLVKDLEATANNMKEITSKLNEGVGTLGALLNDPSAFEDLIAILGGAKRSERLQKVIQYTIEKRKESLKE